MRQSLFIGGNEAMQPDESTSSFSEAELRQLEAWLARPPFVGVAMPLDAMQGLFCAVASAPDLIPPSAWLPAVLGEGIELPGQEAAREAIDLILRFYNATVDELMEGSGLTLELYADDNDEDDYSLWCLGYLEGIGLSTQDWDEEGDELAELMFPISVLSGVAKEMAQEDDLPWPTGEQEETLLATCREHLVDCVMAIHRYWLTRREGSTVVRGSPKIGRNDPCPCGSGKKYKQCCGTGPRLH